MARCFLSGPPALPPALVDWEYNAWGGKYPPFDLDNAVPAHVAELTGRRRFAPGIILEGGAIDGNGEGTMLTTEQCLLNPESQSAAFAGRRRALSGRLSAARKKFSGWRGGIVGDDTDGHIDELARFVGPTTVVAAVEEDPRDENYEPLRDNFRRLRAMTDARRPAAGSDRHSDAAAAVLRRPAAAGLLLNFYIANGVVIVPQFDDPADRVAVETLARLFPGRQIRGLDAVDLVWGLGAFPLHHAAAAGVRFVERPETNLPESLARECSGADSRCSLACASD